jgi:hypothetical protein
MKKIILGTALFALAGTLALAAPRQDRDDHHDNGKHKGQEKHDRGDDRGYDRRDGDRHDEGRHDNGKHKGWEKQQARQDYRDWDHERAHFVPGRQYPHGRYEHVKQVYVARSIDYRTRNVVLYDRSNWVVASYDLDRCRDWQWDRDQVYVYDDDHHPGWYVMYNGRLGRYVHVEFSGVR